MTITSEKLLETIILHLGRAADKESIAAIRTYARLYASEVITESTTKPVEHNHRHLRSVA